MFTLHPFDPLAVLVVALLNPVVIALAFWLGREADQWQKLIVAGFAASMAGFLALYALTFVRIIVVKGFGVLTGVFVAQFLFGILWAWIGYRFWPRRKPSAP